MALVQRGALRLCVPGPSVKWGPPRGNDEHTSSLPCLPERYAGLLCCPTSDVCGPPGLLRRGGHVCAGACTRVCRRVYTGVQAHVHGCTGACTRVCNAHTWALATVHACFHISWDLDLEALMVPGSSCCFGLRVVLGGHQAGVGLGPTPAPQPRLHSCSEHGVALPVSRLLHRSHCLPFTSSLTPQLWGLNYPQVPLLQEALPAAPGFREGVSLSGSLWNILGYSQRFPICPHQHAMSPEGWDYIRSTCPHPFP